MAGTIKAIDSDIQLENVHLDFPPGIKQTDAPFQPLLAHLEKIGDIRFSYPVSPVDQGWELAAGSETSQLVFSAPAEYPFGLTISATPNQAIDYNVPKDLKIGNRVRFETRLSDGAYVYARVQLTSRDARRVSKVGWIACGVGDKPAKKISDVEWLIYRMPRDNGWTLFDLSLPEEVSNSHFGQQEGLRFYELVTIRLRGTLSVSPIEFYR